MTTVLVTGFEPFGGESLNPSWIAVQRLQSRWVGEADLHIRELPVDFASVDSVFVDALREIRPHIVICVGQAGGIPGIHVERVAINIDDARIPDNAGHQPIDEPIVVGAPTAYFASLPIKAAVAELRAQGIPASVSHSAGTFTCNHVFYTLMHEIAENYPTMRGGFVHVPYLPEQTIGTEHPSLPIETMVEALEGIVHATLQHTTDLALTGGTLN
ncbi:MAG TPA: pyroglutamyl-peptidase I [Glaciihabitans sp.]|jgi:pyroglutamyl-peptidase|nr:pyroglutamyl-peptidase I [Glaciihabitans sp.]